MPVEEFKKGKGSDGKEFIIINYVLVLTIESASMVFASEVNGKRLGAVLADFAQDG